MELHVSLCSVGEEIWSCTGWFCFHFLFLFVNIGSGCEVWKIKDKKKKATGFENELWGRSVRTSRREMVGYEVTREKMDIKIQSLITFGKTVSLIRSCPENG